MRKVVAQVDGFNQELYYLTKTERETLSELGRLKNNITNEYDFYFRGKEKETRSEIPAGCDARFDTIIVQVGVTQEIINDQVVQVNAPKLYMKFLYTIEFESRVRGVTVNVTYDCEKTTLENMEYAYNRFLSVMYDIADRDFAFWGTKPERDEDYAD